MPGIGTTLIEPMISVYQRNEPIASHTCTAAVAALLVAAFPALVTYLPEDRRLNLHTVDSLRELKNRARGRRACKQIEVIQDSGHPLMLSYPPNGQETDAKDRQKELWLSAERF